MIRILVLLTSTIAFAAAPCQKDCATLWHVDKSSSIELFSSHPLEKTDLDIEKLVVTVHGVLRNAGEYYAWMLATAKLEGVENRTLIISPHFKSDEDPKTASELFWAEWDWKFGSFSSNENKVSAFTVMDNFIDQTFHSPHFPNLKQIVIVGHSAGGQYLSRYSVTGKLSSALPVHYIIANPSSYLYLTATRPTEDPEKFILPVTTDCPTFDDYGYGMKKRNAYSSEILESILIDRFLSRKVTVLLGEIDTENENLDMGCEANLQGKNRWERGKNFYRYLHGTYPNTKLGKVTVPNVGHDSEKMYQSLEGRNLLFH